MIEIRTTLDRSVYFVKETVKCKIEFKNNSNDQDEVLALSCAQINCHLELDNGNNNNPKMQLTKTSFDQSTNKLIATTPKILFCDITLKPNEAKYFHYEETIPENSPPSYRGQKVKYIHSLCIGTQRIDSAIESIRLPLQIMTVPNNNDKHNQLFMHRTIVDLNMEIIDGLASKKCASTYVIATKKGRLGRFSLIKPSYKLGENIIGVFNFSESKLHCVLYAVSLQSVEETLDAQHSNDMLFRTFNSHNEICMNTEQTQLSISVPLTVSPTFKTDLLSLNWRLHFEFGIAQEGNLRDIIQANKNGHLEILKENIDIETVVWDLPITIYSSHPKHISRYMNADPFVAHYNM